jgi:transcriptional regulator with XRE-family HTH domain
MTFKCLNCQDEMWVCENHRDKPWDKPESEGGCSCGAGMPCAVCNPTDRDNQPANGKEEIGQIIKAVRAKNRMTQAQLSRASGVMQSTVSRTEGGANVGFDKIMKMARVLGCEAHLIGKHEEPKSHGGMAVLATEEAELIGIFRDLRRPDRRKLLSIAQVFNNQRKTAKKVIDEH